MSNLTLGDMAGIRERLVEDRRDFHRNPELAFQEHRTARVVAERLDSLGWNVRTGVGETGVLGQLEGSGGGPTVLIRVDMDGLPVQEPMDRPYSSEVEGLMHACGHDGHMAVGLAVADLLSQRRNHLKGNVKLAFQPAEEIASGAQKMIDDGAMRNPTVDRTLSFHLWSGLPVGQVTAQPGPIFSSADGIRLTIKGKGGHGGMPHLSVDPILISAHVITALQTILSREIAPTETGVLGFGTIQGGTAFNVVSDTVELAGTIRTLDDSVRDYILRRVEEISSQVAQAMRGACEFTHVVGVPPVVNDEEVSKLVTDVAQTVVGTENVVTITPLQLGEDVTLFLRQAPGCFFLVGCGNAAKGITAPHHSAEFDIDEDSLPIAAQIMTEATLRYVA